MEAINRSGLKLPIQLESAAIQGARISIDMKNGRVECEIKGSAASLITAAALLVRNIAQTVESETRSEKDAIDDIAGMAWMVTELNQEAAAADTGDAI